MYSTFRAPVLSAALAFAAADLALAQPSLCADACLLGAERGEASCQLWDADAQAWLFEPINDGPGHLHNRARVYLPWLREQMMPAGGVMGTVFTDTSFQTAQGYSGERDPAIWTGAYLAAEALRFMSTGAPDAQSQLAETVQTLHRWWNLPGDRGYLARFAAPADSDPVVLSALPENDPEVHLNEPYEGELWHWRGNVSRDQYQGVILGYTLAYDATTDPVLRELIRADLVAFAEQLMQRERRKVNIRTKNTRNDVTLELENVVYLESEMQQGRPTLEIDLESGEVTGHGILVFWPRPTDYVRQIRGFGWVPEVRLPSQAIQLAAAFQAALHVSAGVAGYEDRHQALANYYERQVGDWLDLASGWENTNDCGASYHGLNIAFMPAFTWARLEPNATRRAQIQRDVLQARLWQAVAEHKNSFFAFLYAAQAPEGTELGAIIDVHLEQLAQFPTAPNQDLPVDLRGLYPEDPQCPGQSSIAVDVGQRPAASFLWERQPWKLQHNGFEQRLFGGVDYLLAYWLGRHYGFIEDDAPETCLAFTSAPPGAATAAISANGAADVLSIATGEPLSVEIALGLEPILRGVEGIGGSPRPMVRVGTVIGIRNAIGFRRALPLANCYPVIRARCGGLRPILSCKRSGSASAATSSTSGSMR